jgi:hypothetical protein
MHEDNIKMDFNDIEWEYMDWINVVQHRDQSWAVLYKLMNSQGSQEARNLFASWETISL